MIIGLIVVILLLLTVTKKNSNSIVNIPEVINNMLEYDSYSVYIEEYESDLDGKYSDVEDTTEISMNKSSFQYIINQFEDHYYIYEDKMILSKEDDNGDLYWYYKPESIITNRYDDDWNKHDDYWNDFTSIFDFLKDAKFTKKGNNSYSYKPEANSTAINEHFYNIYDLGTGSISTTDTDDIYYYSYEPQEILIEADKDKIVNLVVIFNQSCINELPEFCDGTKKLVFKFDNYNKIETKLPEHVLTSLEKNTAGEWVGKYTNNHVCPNGFEYQETIILTDEFDWIAGAGWDAKLDVFDCESGYKSISDRTYRVEDNKLIILDVRGNTIVEFNMNKNSFNELDENGNIISTFEKISEE